MIGRRIIAIGGGSNGRVKSDGTSDPYETEAIDREIVKLANASSPNFLFLAHSQSDAQAEESYFITMRKIFGDRCGCKCRALTRLDLLQSADRTESLLAWADIIYEGGGDTLAMMKLWKDTGFDKRLRQAWETGKVMCGLSAGANCWFNACSSDSLQIENGPDQPLIKVDGLGFINGLFTPHADEPGRLEHAAMLLKENDTVGFSVSNCAAIEIVDNTFRILTGDVSARPGFEPFVLKSYWQNGEYKRARLPATEKFIPLNVLLDRNLS